MNTRLRRRASVNNKYLLISVVIILLTVMSLGFAYIERRLSINGNVSLDVKKKIEPISNLFSSAQSDKGIVDFSKTSVDNGTNGVYMLDSTKNDSYPIYYYRGAVNNNIIFAGFCWKIVRTTETGGTKLIYHRSLGSGNTCEFTNTVGLIPPVSAFGSYIDVGYGNSTVKTFIDTWYKNNILTNYEKYLEDTVWCNDRSGIDTSSSGTVYSNAYYRLAKNYKPSLICENKEDRYTLKNTHSLYNANLDGNGYLTYPVGLLTADEVVMAGGKVSTDNYSYYLYNSQSWWTMTPYNYYSTQALMFEVVNFISFSPVKSNSTCGVRFSVSLKPDIMITTAKIVTSGSGAPGSATNPYIVVEE